MRLRGFTAPHPQAPARGHSASPFLGLEETPAHTHTLTHSTAQHRHRPRVVRATRATPHGHTRSEQRRGSGWACAGGAGRPGPSRRGQARTPRAPPPTHNAQHSHRLCTARSHRATQHAGIARSEGVARPVHRAQGGRGPFAAGSARPTRSATHERSTSSRAHMGPGIARSARLHEDCAAVALRALRPLAPRRPSRGTRRRLGPPRFGSIPEPPISCHTRVSVAQPARAIHAHSPSHSRPALCTLIDRQGSLCIGQARTHAQRAQRVQHSGSALVYSCE